MNRKYYFIILTLFLIPFNVIADDNFYAISGNILISNNYKILTNEKINNLLIDNSSIYFFNQNNFYIFTLSSIGSGLPRMI